MLEPRADESANSSSQITVTSPLNWFPLATEQLRLRSLSEIWLCQPSTPEGAGGSDVEHYITLHDTALSPPFYTSCPASLEDGRLQWKDVGAGGAERGAARAVILRLWVRQNPAGTSQSLLVWGVNFSGLVCLGDSSSSAAWTAPLQPDTFVFKLHHHHFVPRESLLCAGPAGRFLEVPFIPTDSCKLSYSRAGLVRLAALLRSQHQAEADNGRVKDEIRRRMDSSPAAAAASASLTASIRQQIFSVRPKLASTKAAELSLAVSLENLRWRLELRREERDRLRAAVAAKRVGHAQVEQEVEEGGSRLMRNYHALAKDREKLSVWLQSFQEFKETNRKAAAALKVRRTQLISQLGEIFPIHDESSAQPTICHVVVPASESMKDRDETDLAVGLGWTCHLTVMVASLLHVPLRYPATPAGSRSSLSDLALARTDRERQFPLHPRGADRARFEYAVYLLSKNIAQLRWHCSLHTADLRPCLANLAGLLSACAARHEPEQGSQQGGQQLGSSPPAPSPPPTGLTSENSSGETAVREDKVVPAQVEAAESSDRDESPHHQPHFYSSVIFDSTSSDALQQSVGDEANCQGDEVQKPAILEESPVEDGDMEEDIVEQAVEADFWDSVTSRTEQLSKTSSFKTLNRSLK